MKIAIIGDGGWGTALAILLGKKAEPEVCLWSAFAEYAAAMRRTHENKKFLAGISIPAPVRITADLEEALRSAAVVILAVPSKYLRGVLKKINSCAVQKPLFISAAKGIEPQTLLRMSEVIRAELGNIRLCVLSGPNIAYEVARGVPSAAVCAGSPAHTATAQDVLMRREFRVYTARDVVGVELAGTMKNIIAIACGIADGLGFGTNTKGALLTRGLAEMARLGVAMGARYDTFSGLSGMGDLVTTCLSPRSRNRCLGEEIGKGRALSVILAGTEMVIEGVEATKAVRALSHRYQVDLPITREVYQGLFRKKNPRRAVDSLMSRSKKNERA
ncbi:MAG: NAD(P)-dependent glycerol-3-phosphate dehydrogenase [Candidatus Omnitrophica bacterium]|nr:NAD(P)-dependent glycerol-3-phosphate dehydrogenase [Candidatus Omnitrophota bacterium]